MLVVMPIGIRVQQVKESILNVYTICIDFIVFKNMMSATDHPISWK